VLGGRRGLLFVAGAAGPAEAAARAAAVLPNQRYDPAIAAGALVAHPVAVFSLKSGQEVNNP